jgi:LacI family transcriptional regulator
MPTDDLARSCCQNPDCDHYGARGAGNLSVCGHFGKHQRLRLLSCHTCKARFSENKGTAFFRSKLPTETALSALQHLAEGNGTRQTARLVGVHRDTVTRLARLAGEHARDAHEELVAFSPQDP